MTYILELKEETVRLLEAKAAAQGLTPSQFVESLFEDEDSSVNRSEQLMKMADALFDKRASAYEALAEGAK